MSNVLTVKQEAFVTNYLAGDSQVDAYANAGYSGERHTLYPSAHKLLYLPKIQVEIAKRQKATATAEGLSLEQLVSELLQNGREARELKQMSASTQAFVAAGKALGLIVDKHEFKSTSISVQMTQMLDGMSPEELEAAAAKVTLELPEATETKGE